MPPNTLEKARAPLAAALATPGPRLVTRPEIQALLIRAKSDMGVAKSVGVRKLTDFLEKRCGLRRLVLRSEDYSPVLRLCWGDVSPYTIALSLRPGGYLSHGSAVYLHALTDQNPKVIYVNVEQGPKPKPKIGLSQDRIDRAFSRRQRLSNLAYWLEPFRIVLISGKYSRRAGVEQGDIDGATGVPVTCLERTLIDIVVRPGYAGGLVQVLEAYRAARGRASVSRVQQLLRSLDHVYPYHQAIGFLLDRAGYPESSLGGLRSMVGQFRFYLGYGVKERDYDADWRIYFPRGF